MLAGERVPVAYDIYPMDDPIGGARLVRLTEDDCATGTKWRKVLRGTGEGTIILHADHPAVTAGYFVEGNYVRVVECHPDFSEKVIGGFWLKAGSETVISRKEGGGEYRKLGGPGTIDLFNRATFPYILRSAGDTHLDAHNDFLTANGYLRFNGPETYGGILRRVFLEAQLDDPSALPADLPDPDWDDVDDSAGTDWSIFDDYYDVRMGDSVLDIFLDLMRKGIDLIIDPDTFVSHAYVAGSYGTDRTSATFATNKVRFQRTVNIRSDLDKALYQLPYASHVLAIGEDGKTRVLRIDPDWSPGDLVVRDTIHVAGTNDGDILAEAALESIRLRKLATAQARFPIVSGNAQTQGLYLPGRHFDVGDLVTLHTGTGPHEYDEQPIQVAAIEWEIISGRGHDVTVELGAQYIDPNTAREISSLTTLIRDTGGLKLCTALDPGTESVYRFYFSSGNSGIEPATSALWDDDASADADRSLTTAPDSSLGTGGSGLTASVGTGGIDVRLGQFITNANIGSGLAALLAAGGATIRGVMRARSRSGIGITEANQHNIWQLTLRVLQGATSTVRGVPYAGHSLAGTDSSEFPAQTTHLSRVFPPSAASDVLAAVPGTVSTDRIVLELGYRSFSTSTTGAAILPVSTGSADLPETDGLSTGDNAWVEVRGITAPLGGGLAPALVGDDTSAARCDHRHHVLSNRGPTSADDITQGYPTTTHWTNTETAQTWFLIDEDTGDWLLIGDPEHTHPDPIPTVEALITDETDDTLFLAPDGSGGVEWVAGPSATVTVEEEDGTPTGAFDTLKFTNGTVTDNGDGSVSVDVSGGGGGGGGVTVLSPSSDTYINQQATTTNYDSATDVLIGNAWGTASFTRFILLTFDISALAGLNIGTAILSLVRTDSASAAVGDLIVNARKILRAYNATQVTWNVYSTGNNWTTGGGQSAGNDISTERFGGYFIPDNVAGWEIQIDIGRMLQQALDASETTLRVMVGFNRNTNSSNSMSIASIENATTAYRPKLRVTHS